MPKSLELLQNIERIRRRKKCSKKCRAGLTKVCQGLCLLRFGISPRILIFSESVIVFNNLHSGNFYYVLGLNTFYWNSICAHSLLACHWAQRWARLCLLHCPLHQYLSALSTWDSIQLLMCLVQGTLDCWHPQRESRCQKNPKSSVCDCASDRTAALKHTA